MSKLQIFYVANMSFNTIRENEILAKNSELTVFYTCYMSLCDIVFSNLRIKIIFICNQYKISIWCIYNNNDIIGLYSSKRT